MKFLWSFAVGRFVAELFVKIAFKSVPIYRSDNSLLSGAISFLTFRFRHVYLSFI
jgi:hypothetical protein